MEDFVLILILIILFLGPITFIIFWFFKSLNSDIDFTKKNLKDDYEMRYPNTYFVDGAAVLTFGIFIAVLAYLSFWKEYFVPTTTLVFLFMAVGIFFLHLYFGKRIFVERGNIYYKRFLRKKGEISPEDISSIEENTKGLEIFVKNEKKSLLVSNKLLSYDRFKKRMIRLSKARGFEFKNSYDKFILKTPANFVILCIVMTVVLAYCAFTKKPLVGSSYEGASLYAIIIIFVCSLFFTIYFAAARIVVFEDCIHQNLFSFCYGKKNFSDLEKSVIDENYIILKFKDKSKIIVFKETNGANLLLERLDMKGR